MKIFFFIAVALWLIPFMLRVFVIDFSVSAETLNSDECIESKISQAINDNNEIKAFILLVTNNLKGCVINILGGAL